MTYDELNYRIGVSVDESIKDDSSLIFHLLPPAEQAVGEKLVDISMKSNGWVVFRAEVIDVPSSVFYDKLDKVLHCKFNLVETHRVIHILPDYNNMPFVQLSETALQEIWRRIKGWFRRLDL